jgi:hypothetical protein
MEFFRRNKEKVYLWGFLTGGFVWSVGRLVRSQHQRLLQKYEAEKEFVQVYVLLALFGLVVGSHSSRCGAGTGWSSTMQPRRRFCSRQWENFCFALRPMFNSSRVWRYAYHKVYLKRERLGVVHMWFYLGHS